MVHCTLCIVTMVSQFYTSAIKRIFKNAILIGMFLSLMITSADRYYCIMYPFEYGVTSKYVVLILLCSWIPSIISVSLSVILGLTNYHCVIICTVLIAVSTLVLLGTNLKLYMVAQRHALVIKKYHVGKYFKSAVELKATFVCFAIVFSFILLWFPYGVHNALTLVNIYNPSTEKGFTLSVIKLSLLNSLVDPLLFVIFNRDIKEELGKILRRNSKRLEEFRLKFNSSYTSSV